MVLCEVWGESSGGLMVSALDYEASGPGSRPGPTSFPGVGAKIFFRAFSFVFGVSFV